MLNKLITRISIPRWLILCIDLGLVFFSLSLAYLLRFNFSIPENEFALFNVAFPLVLGFRGAAFLVSKTYKGVIRYTSSEDILRITAVLGIGTILLMLMNAASYYYQKIFLIPFGILILEFLCTSFFMIIPRLLVKLVYYELKFSKKPKLDVIIYGAGELAVITKRTLERDREAKYNIIAFVDENPKKINTTMEGIRVYGFKDLDHLIKTNNVSHIIIGTQRISIEKKKEIVDLCLAKSITVRHIPPVDKWINGELSFNQIKHVKIEDLLGRDEIIIDINKIRKELKNKVVLITGAAGSIGSEIVRQVLKFDPQKVILFDQAESALYDLNSELTELYPNKKWENVIGDVKNKERLKRMFEIFKPQIVFHTAAYKHVPLMEENPSEAILTNIKGTKQIANLSAEFNIEKFVMVSTDKAVNPTNVMGATKRAAEIYIQSLNKISNTKFITTRFGNVLGSNGSVIPLFRRQIQKGGPITVTHPDITRYFMTIPEACQLVLEAGYIGNGGEIFVFDMGESVKILDLAKKMIQLSGLELGKDIQIKFTGLRPGEKLYEELLNDKENTMPTHHPQILVGKVREYDFEEIRSKIRDIIQLADNQDKNEEIVKKLKELIPEYVSNNSEYCLLD